MQFCTNIAPANSLSGSRLSGTNQTDLFTIGPGSLNCFGPARRKIDGGRLKTVGDNVCKRGTTCHHQKRREMNFTFGPQQLSALCSLLPQRGV